MTSYVLQIPGALKRAAVRVLNRAGLYTLDQRNDAMVYAERTERQFQERCTDLIVSAWRKHVDEIKRELDGSNRMLCASEAEVVRLKRQLEAVDRFRLSRGFIAQL